MFALAAAALLLTGACKESCLRHLTDARLKATVCGRCFTQGDRGAWAASLGGYEKEVPLAQLEGLLDDDDWAVRWGGIKSLAARKQQSESQVLSGWITGHRSTKACTTLVHVCGLQHQQATAVAEPAAVATCWELRKVVRSSLELGLYDENLGTRLEAVQHLSSYFETSPARTVLDAMKTRGPESDALSAQVLQEAAAPVGRAILEVPKTAADTPLINRLLAVYARQIDTQRPHLHAPETAVRREAIATLAELAPLSSADLEASLEDEDAANRRSAAMALARGEGLPLAAYAKRKLEPSTPPATAITWLGFLGSARDHDCRPLIEQTLRDERLDLKVRAAALPALIDCAGKPALGTVAKQLDAPEAGLRAGATRALGLLPRVPDVVPLLERRLTDGDVEVLIAAARASGPTHERRLLPGLTNLTAHAEAAVREEAVNAIARMEVETTVPTLAKVLEKDPDARVRAACALALGNLGGSAALPSLVAASESDKDSNVKFVAAESLRKLGFQRSAGSMSK